MILVTGATGPVGRLLIDSLLARGAAVRALSRDPGAAALPAGVEVVAGDAAGEPSPLTGALTDVTALFLHPRVVGARSGELLALARERGVRRVVALSAMNVDDPLDEQPSRFAGDRNKEAEEAAAASGLAWSSLRASSFAGNTARAWAPQIRAGDVVRYPFAAFRESLLDERDLAEVGAHELLRDPDEAGDDAGLTAGDGGTGAGATGDSRTGGGRTDGGTGPAGRRLRLTGPQSLSHREAVDVLGQVLGRQLRYEEVPPEAAARGMVRRGMPEPFVTALMARYARHLEHPQHPATDDVQRVLGRPARGYATWAAHHADAFRA